MQFKWIDLRKDYMKKDRVFVAVLFLQKDRCDQYEISGPHLWFYRREECLFVACGSDKDKYDHSGDYEKEKAHPLQFNSKTKRL